MSNRTAATIAVMLFFAAPAEADRVDQNLQRMLDAARNLEHPDWSDNRAWLLEKVETTRSPVAVVFGYADSDTACREIPMVLSASGDAGTFECTPFY